MRARRERLAESRSEQGFLRGRQQQRVSGKLETGWKPSITAQLEPGGPVRTMGPGWQRGDVIAPEEAAERAGLLGDAAKWQRGGDIAQQEQLMLQGQQAYERLFPLLTPAQREAAGTEAQGQAAQAETQKDEAKLAAHKDEQLAAQQDTIPRWLLERMMGAQQQTAQAGEALAGMGAGQPEGPIGYPTGSPQDIQGRQGIIDTMQRYRQPADQAVSRIEAPGLADFTLPTGAGPTAEQQYATRQTVPPITPSDAQHDVVGGAQQNLAGLQQAQQSLFAGPSYTPLPTEAGPLGAAGPMQGLRQQDLQTTILKRLQDMDLTKRAGDIMGTVNPAREVAIKEQLKKLSSRDEEGNLPGGWDAWVKAAAAIYRGAASDGERQLIMSEIQTHPEYLRRKQGSPFHKIADPYGLMGGPRDIDTDIFGKQ